MFSFFSKKHFIADFLEGVTDMHCHLLPGIDDGAKDEEMTISMLKEYENLGYVGAIVTPHIMEGFYDNTSGKVKEVFENFENLKNSKGFTSFKSQPAAEYMLDQSFNDLIKNKDLLRIKDNLLLVEMSYFQMTNFVDYQLFDLQQLGIKPILAHPERYSYLGKPSEVLEFKRKGCRLQLNLLSLSGHYGPTIAKQAFSLLADDEYDFFGTDAHHDDHLKKIRQIQVSKKYIPHFEKLVAKTKEEIFI